MSIGGTPCVGPASPPRLGAAAPSWTLATRSAKKSVDADSAAHPRSGDTCASISTCAHSQSYSHTNSYSHTVTVSVRYTVRYSSLAVVPPKDRRAEPLVPFVVCLVVGYLYQKPYTAAAGPAGVLRQADEPKDARLLQTFSIRIRAAFYLLGLDTDVRCP
eukprot:1649825-Pyramimonas_sp.AAC.1